MKKHSHLSKNVVGTLKVTAGVYCRTSGGFRHLTSTGRETKKKSVIPPARKMSSYYCDRTLLWWWIMVLALPRANAGSESASAQRTSKYVMSLRQLRSFNFLKIPVFH